MLHSASLSSYEYEADADARAMNTSSVDNILVDFAQKENGVRCELGSAMTARQAWHKISIYKVTM